MDVCKCNPFDFNQKQIQYVIGPSSVVEWYYSHHPSHPLPLYVHRPGIKIYSYYENTVALYQFIGSLFQSFMVFPTDSPLPAILQFVSLPTQPWIIPEQKQTQPHLQWYLDRMREKEKKKHKKGGGKQDGKTVEVERIIDGESWQKVNNWQYYLAHD